MQTTTNHTLTSLLRERMEDLLFEVVEMQDYLSGTPVDGKKQDFPLGVMGQVISLELQQEALTMLEKTEDIICEPSVDGWEKTRTSIYLNRKLSALGFFMRIIAQLPASSQTAHNMAESMADRIHQHCVKVEYTLSQMTLQSVAQPA